MNRAIIAAAAVCAWACVPAVAWAGQTAKLEVTLIPDRLGAGTTIDFGFQIEGTGGGVPSPLTKIDLRYPANLGIGSSGLGLESCGQDALDAFGPQACPADSQMGYGSALVVVPFGPDLVEETARTRTFSAPVSKGRLALLFFAEGETPISAQLVFPAVVATAPPPYGGSLNTALPLVPSFPEGPDAAVVKLRSTIGPLNLTYYEQVHGKRVAYTPKGIVLPKSCPRGGFPFAANFSFQDASHTSATASVPCPSRRRPRL